MHFAKTALYRPGTRQVGMVVVQTLTYDACGLDARVGTRQSCVV